MSQEQTTYVSPLMSFTSHNSKTFEHKTKHCKTMIRESDRTSNVKKCTRKWCSYHHSNGHPNEKCYQQQQSGKRWCTYHKNRSHSDDHCYHQINDSRNSPADSVCVFFPSILDIKFVGRTSRGHTGGRSHRIFHPPSFCGACLDFCREKDSAIPFPRRP